MRKFCQDQAMHKLSLLCDKNVHSLSPKCYTKQLTSIDSKAAMDTYTMGVSRLLDIC